MFTQHSGWLLPAGFAFAIMLLSGLLLGWYLRPGPGARRPHRPIRTRCRSRWAALSLARASQLYPEPGGARRAARRRALPWPRCFRPGRAIRRKLARLFQGNAPDSAVVRILIRRDANAMDAATRLERIYRP